MLILLAAVAGCGDLETSPPIDLVTQETAPALHFGTALPTLPALVDCWGRSLPLGDVGRSWAETWSAEPEEGARARSELYRGILPVLSPEVPPEEVVALVRTLEATLAEIDSRFGGGLSTSLETPVFEAGAARNRALRALDEERPGEALLHILEAVDHLHATTPAALARALIDRGEVALTELGGGIGGSADGPPARRNGTSDPYDSERHTRARRLLIGAAAALDEGQDALALRRAYYANRLLTEAGSW